MSERSIYLRNQADKCRWHADKMTDAETQAELRKLAAEYIVRAAEIEGFEIKKQRVREPPEQSSSAPTFPPWNPRRPCQSL
jgi:hypothetical protein